MQLKLTRSPLSLSNIYISYDQTNSLNLNTLQKIIKVLSTSIKKCNSLKENLPHIIPNSLVKCIIFAY